MDNDPPLPYCDRRPAGGLTQTQCRQIGVAPLVGPHLRRKVTNLALVAAVALTGALGVAPAMAQPPGQPPDSSDPRQRYEQLGAKAAAAEEDLAETEETAARAVASVRARQATLDQQIQQVRTALGQLPASEREQLGTVQDSGSYAGPPGAANDALQAALSKRGSEYEGGASGPDEIDCSGLTSWAYNQAGVSIPRTSRQQYGAGKPVGMNELRPGDLVFYDDGSGDPGAIHHVGMYVGDGKMVDAPTEGQVVDIRSIEGDGHYIGARRIVG